MDEQPGQGRGDEIYLILESSEPVPSTPHVAWRNEAKNTATAYFDWLNLSCLMRRSVAIETVIRRCRHSQLVHCVVHWYFVYMYFGCRSGDTCRREHRVGLLQAIVRARAEPYQALTQVVTFRAETWRQFYGVLGHSDKGGLCAGCSSSPDVRRRYGSIDELCPQTWRFSPATLLKPSRTHLHDRLQGKSQTIDLSL